jgi:hypothetical protein
MPGFLVAAFAVTVLGPYATVRAPGYEPSTLLIDAEYPVSISRLPSLSSYLDE